MDEKVSVWCKDTKPHNAHGDCAGTDNIGYAAEFGSCGKTYLHVPHPCGETMETWCDGEKKHD